MSWDAVFRGEAQRPAARWHPLSSEDKRGPAPRRLLGRSARAARAVVSIQFIHSSVWTVFTKHHPYSRPCFKPGVIAVNKTDILAFVALHSHKCYYRTVGVGDTGPVLMTPLSPWLRGFLRA